MKTLKTFSSREAIMELANKHGVDFLTARNLISGKKEVSELEINEIAERVHLVRAETLTNVKVRKLKPVRKTTKRAATSSTLYKETKDYVTGIEWGAL